MARDTTLRLLDMQSSIQIALAMTAGLNKLDFDTDSIRYDACLYRIIVVAEAAGKLPANVRQKAPEIPWPNLISMGNNLKHQYFRVEADVVWDTVANHFPTLLRAIERLLALEAALLDA